MARASQCALLRLMLPKTRVSKERAMTYAETRYGGYIIHLALSNIVLEKTKHKKNLAAVFRYWAALADRLHALSVARPKVLRRKSNIASKSHRTPTASVLDVSSRSLVSTRDFSLVKFRSVLCSVRLCVGAAYQSASSSGRDRSVGFECALLSLNIYDGDKKMYI